MYLHLGGDVLVKTGEVIGLFDLDTTTVSARTREFLARAEREKRVVNASYELPKSFCAAAPAAARRRKRKGKPAAPAKTARAGPGPARRVYISQLGTATLKKRLGAAPDSV